MAIEKLNENQHRWILDTAFREDESRVCQDYGAENMAILRPLGLNLLKKGKTAKGGNHAKRLQTVSKNDYLLPILKS